MDFPAEPAEPAPPPDGLARALGVEPAYVGRNRFDYLVEVDSEATVRRLAPDIGALARLPVRGVIVTARGARPRGSTSCRVSSPLAPVWTRTRSRGPRTAASAPTGAAGSAATRSPRGRRRRAVGVVKVAVAGDRVRLSGQAVTILRGELLA